MSAEADGFREHLGYNSYLQTEPATIKTALAAGYDYAADTYQTAALDGGIVASLGGTVEYFAVNELYSEQGVRIVSEMFAANGNGEPIVFVELVNTSDQMVAVRVGDFCLNGLQVQSGIWSVNSINSGKRRVLALQLDDMLDMAVWEAYGLDAVGKISFTLAQEDGNGNTLCDGSPVTLAIPDAEAAYRSDGDVVYSSKGVQILHVGTEPDAFGLSDDIHLLFLAENGTEQVICFETGYDTLSVNGYMADFFCIGPTLAPGRSGVLDVELRGNSLAKIGIGSVEDIKTVELTFVLCDDRYNELDKATVTLGEADRPTEDAPVGANGTNGANGAETDGVSPDFKEVMDSYEAFFDEYAAFMEKYQNSGNPTSMLMDYLSFLSRYAEAMQKLDDIDTDSLSAADRAYYTQVMLRISGKLISAAG